MQSRLVLLWHYLLVSFGVLVSSGITVHLVGVLRSTANMEVQNHYEVLGLALGATKSEIIAAWKKSILVHRPDKGNDPDAEMFRRVQLAYEVLTNATARTEHDTLLNQGPPPGPWSQTVFSRASHASASIPMSRRVSADSSVPLPQTSVPLSSLVRSWSGYWAVNLQAPDWWSHSLWRRAHITQ
jgi:curved DNA-binding protein CbpA